MNMVDEPLLSTTPLKIGLIEAPPYIYKNTLGEITGYEYDIIKRVVSENNLTVEYDYIEEKGRKYTYNELIDLLASGYYDVLIGNISQTYTRSKIIIYGTPVAMDIGAFYYIPDKNKYTYLNIVNSNEIMVTILKLFISVIIVSFILSVVHYSIVPSELSYKESLWRVSATLFGEPGYVLNPKLNANISSSSSGGLVIRVIIIFIASLIGVFLTSYVTGSIVSSSLKSRPFNDMNDLYGKTIVVRGGQSEEVLLTHYKDLTGMKIVVVDEKGDTTFNILDRAITSDKSIDAFFMSSSKKVHNDEYDIYEKGNVILEKGLTSFAFNRNHVKLSQMVNISISKMREQKFMKELCDKYFSIIQDVCIQ